MQAPSVATAQHTLPKDESRPEIITEGADLAALELKSPEDQPSGLDKTCPNR